MRRSNRVADYMTPSSHMAGTAQPLPSAAARMRQLGLRYLPVVHDGKLCGVLSEHDVARAESRPRAELAHLSVGTAMGRDLYPVAPAAPLVHVARTMAAHDYGCAVVMEDGAVIGVFALNDALRALAGLLEAQQADQDEIDASEARAVILTEHAHVDGLLTRAQRAVHRLRGGSDPEHEVRRVRGRARHLRDAVRSYLELEERQLTPSLSELTGSSRSLGQQLTEEHHRQIADAAALAAVLEEPDLPPASLAVQLEHSLANLRRDLEREHALLLALDAASNDHVITDAAAD